MTTNLSRREAESRILSGDVEVNGVAVLKLGTKVDPQFDDVRLCKKKLLLSDVKLRYIAYHKPVGRLVTNSDPHGRPTIWRDLKGLKGTLNYAGRLDFDSEGLLILSNDGDFINRLIHPRHEIWKKYVVDISGDISDEGMKRLMDGIFLDGEKTVPAKVKYLKKINNGCSIEVQIREGRKRQIRRMCDAIGHKVLRLTRISVGSIELGALKPGESRELSKEEIEAVYE